MNELVTLKNIVFYREDNIILENINWTIKTGQHWALLGPNGSGKTTLLKIITGYAWASEGSVKVLGRSYGECDLPELRRKIGWVSSSLEHRISDHENTLNVVSSGLDATIGVYRDFNRR